MTHTTTASTPSAPSPRESLATRLAERTGCASVAISPGWEPIVARLDAELRAMDPGYQLCLLQAHSGVLSLAWSPSQEPGWPTLALDADEDARKRYEDEVGRYLLTMVHRRRLEWEDQVVRAGRELVAEAAREAAHTCEGCGAPGFNWTAVYPDARQVLCSPCRMEAGFYR